MTIGCGSSRSFGDTSVDALVTAGTNLLGSFQFDQFLQHAPHLVTDQIHTFAGAGRVQ
jgi:hypothetical protein